MKTLFFTSKSIADFIVNYGRGPNTKDYEFIAAIWLKKFCEKQWGTECRIGFNIKPDFHKQLSGQTTIALIDIAKLFRNGINEDSQIDCIISKNEENESGNHEGVEFQIKRFGLGRNEVSQNTLSEYINSFKNKYGRTQTSLFIILDGTVSGEIDFNTLLKTFDTKNFPFDRLMFGWMHSDTIYVGEIYPEYGMEEFIPSELVI